MASEFSLTIGRTSLDTPSRPRKVTRAVRLAVYAIIGAALFSSGSAQAADTVQPPATPLGSESELMKTGKFSPTWESLEQYQTPDWFRDAKFGIWAHWGPQCEPEDGDWYARNMYVEGHKNYKDHLAKYGHPSKFGFKDVINEFKAENWDPDKLVALYKKTGAQYFMALANHHDNFDMYDSKYQPWNAVNMGPKKDIIAGWAKAAHEQGLKFGVSVHAAHAWAWYETSQGSDKKGDFAGVPYDGNMTKADGKGLWWDGYDPQDLYAQNHKPGKLEWNWDVKKGASEVDPTYSAKFYNRTVDLINKYKPDMVYFDDTVLPMYPISDVGMKIAAHYYNSSMEWNGGKVEAVIYGKVLNADQRKAMVWDIERGQSHQIEPLPWQCDTCIGDWHYNISRFEKHNYKSVKTVVQMLADIVSKNGNLCLNIPVRGDGTIDNDEVKFLDGLGKWMDVNKEAIFATRPWKVFGEGPAIAGAAAIKEQGFNEGKGKPFTAEDVRFTSKGKDIYLIVLGRPTKDLNVKSLGKAAKLFDGDVGEIKLLGGDAPVEWAQADDGLTIKPAAADAKLTDDALVYKVSPK